MRVNHNNPVSLFAANPAASKAKFASATKESGSRPGIAATTTTYLIPQAKTLKTDIAASVSDPASVATDIQNVNADKKFVLPEGATLSGLMENWGKGPSKYDFTQDGQVDAQDMLMMIRNWQDSFGEQPAEPSSDPVDVDAPASAPIPSPSMIETPAPAPPIEETDSLPSLPDITVASTSTPTPTIPTPDPVGPVNPSEPNENTTPTMGGLLSAWGQDNSTYDFNTDGTVNVEDLLMMLSNWPSGQGYTPEIVQDTFENAEPARRNTHSASASGKLQRLADQISTRLSAEGFGDQPPVNLRELVAQLNLSPKQSDFLMKQMQAKYPKGLGVSVIA